MNINTKHIGSQASKPFDVGVLHQIQNGFASARLNRWVSVFTQLGGATSVIAGTLVLSLIQQDHGQAMLVLLFSHVLVHVLKKITARVRPYEVLHSMIDLRSSKMSDSSFPSGHTAATWTFATQVMLAYPILAPVMIPLALFVGWSRIYLGLHYPSDVVVGMIIGIFIPAACLMNIW